MSERKLRDAEQFAEKLVRDSGLVLPIDVLSIAAERDILVEAKPANGEGVSGMLIRSGENFAIAYATHIKSEGFQRFSIAHELGHYFLEGHPEAVFKNGNMHESHAGFGSIDQIELEADHFAAGLLMPRHLFYAAAGRYPDGLKAIKGLERDCRTSLTASAIRYAELTDAAVAVIISRGPTVDYCVASEALRRVKGYRHLKKGSALPRNSLSLAFNKDPGNVASAREDSDETDLADWFHAEQEIEASEEMVGLGSYGKTLTVITADIPDEDEDEANSGGGWRAPQFKY
jgi:Zn-dependent peptidase ImmA (M78 family)